MHKIRLATSEDAETLVRLRMTFLEEVGNFAEGEGVFSFQLRACLR
jgi:hypothetical protein